MKALNIIAQLGLGTLRAGTQALWLTTKMANETAIIADAAVLTTQNRARKKLDPDHFLNNLDISNNSFKENVRFVHDMDTGVSQLIDGRKSADEFLGEVFGTIMQQTTI